MPRKITQFTTLTLHYYTERGRKGRKEEIKKGRMKTLIQNDKNNIEGKGRKQYTIEGT